MESTIQLPGPPDTNPRNVIFSETFEDASFAFEFKLGGKWELPSLGGSVPMANFVPAYDTPANDEVACDVAAILGFDLTAYSAGP